MIASPLPSDAGTPTLAVQPLRPAAPGNLPLVASSQLFCQGSPVRIEHAGQIYQLRVTRENRLILTK